MTRPLSPDAPTEDPDFFFPDFAPVPMQRRRANGWTPRHQRLFIAMLAETGSVSVAAQCVGLSARSAYKLREKDGAEAFALTWEEALEIGIGKARDTILDRWRNGRMAPRWYRGRIIGYEEKFNERALIAALYSMQREAAGGNWRRRAYRELRLEAAEAERVAESDRTTEDPPHDPANELKLAVQPEPRLRHL